MRTPAPQDVATSHVAPREIPSPRLLSAWVAAGGAAGAVARHAISGGLATPGAASFPWGTLTANALGSLLLGCFAGAAVAQMRPETRAGLTVGLCGGITTFSTFDLQLHALLHSGAWATALAYAGGSVALCVGGVLAGLRLAGARGGGRIRDGAEDP